MSMRIQLASPDLTRPTFSQEWTANDGRQIVAIWFGGGEHTLVFDDPADGLALADVLQDAARRLRLRQLAAERREAVPAS